MSACYYKTKIMDIRAKMLSVRPHLHPANRVGVYSYFYGVLKGVTTLTASVDDTYQTRSLWKRFKSYVDGEESRLEQKLKDVHYNIDALDTLSLITGPGRIEKVGATIVVSKTFAY